MSYLIGRFIYEATRAFAIIILYGTVFALFFGLMFALIVILLPIVGVVVSRRKIQNWRLNNGNG